MNNHQICLIVYHRKRVSGSPDLDLEECEGVVEHEHLEKKKNKSNTLYAQRLGKLLD